MKRWITLITVLLLTVTAFCACAEGDLRHEATGDVSTFEVAEEKGLSRGEVNETKTEATLGTEIYLIVDDETASYVTFYVTDEQDEPIEGALIYITYNGISELYGVTDEQGRCSMYLFRHVEYGYRVEKSGYETAEGHFTAEEETKEVRVALRKRHALTIYVVDGQVRQPGVTVLIGGRSLTTDDEGKVQLRLTDGEYDGVIVTADGRRIPFKAIVNGDTVLVVDIGTDAGEGFLVYNKLYQPEDYVLTRYLYTAQDVSRLTGETEEDYALRVERYLAENAGVILVQAQPEREQLETADRDMLNKDGTPLYSQRSCMPMGALLRAWEDEGAQTLIFTNEDVGVALPLAELHGANMAKLYALVETLHGGSVRSIVTEETRNAWQGLERAGLAELDAQSVNVTSIDWNAIVPCAFAFDEADGAQKALPSTMFDSTLFEFRITPILPEALLDAAVSGFTEESPMERDVIMLASRGYFTEELRQWQADGRLTDTECRELFHCMTDGMLTAEEMKNLRQMADEGTLSYGAVEYLVQAAMDGKLYRISCWLISGDVRVDFTALLDGLQVIWPSEERYAAAYDAQLQLLMQEKNLTAEETAAQYALQLEAQALQAMEQAYGMRTVDRQGGTYASWGYEPGAYTQSYPVQALRALPALDDEFYEVLLAKRFEQLTVDVRRENIRLNEGSAVRFHASVTAGTTVLEEAYALAAGAPVSGLAWLRSIE